MSPRISRRALLRSVGVAAAVGLAGCGSGDGGTATPTSTTYDVEVQNDLTPEDFEMAPDGLEPTPATVSFRVNAIAAEETFFEETVELETGASETFTDAFTVEPDGPTYAMNAELEGFTDEGLSDPRNQRDGLTFTPAERPDVDTITVVVLNINPEDRDVLFPAVSIRA